MPRFGASIVEKDGFNGDVMVRVKLLPQRIPFPVNKGHFFEQKMIECVLIWKRKLAGALSQKLYSSAGNVIFVPTDEVDIKNRC